MSGAVVRIEVHPRIDWLFDIRFDYDRDLIELVKQVDSTRFDTDRKVWTVINGHVDELAYHLIDHGVRVRWDGVINSVRFSAARIARAMQAERNPPWAWFRQLPQDLRRPMYVAMRDVLDGHPELRAELVEAAGTSAKRRRLSA
jgi:hypothetical protein